MPVHVLRHRPGDEQSVGVARRRDELNAGTVPGQTPRCQHVHVGLAAVAAAGAHLPQFERAAKIRRVFSSSAGPVEIPFRRGPNLPARSREAMLGGKAELRLPGQARSHSAKRQQPRSSLGPFSPRVIASVGQTSAQWRQPDGHFAALIAGRHANGRAKPAALSGTDGAMLLFERGPANVLSMISPQS